jgi:GTPase Era involved in 16S rRNA processing
MSAADTEMDARERRYLEIIGDRLNINPRHLAVLEAVFSRQGTVDTAELDEMKSLLDPSRFHELDTVFVNAASNILAAFPAKPEQKQTQQQPAQTQHTSPQPEHKKTRQHRDTAYEQLQQFQITRNELTELCNQILKILKTCTERSLIPNKLSQDIEKVSQKLQSQRFRVALVGEFSQGKSTLLNALLGEEIQPVRAIPCSGAISVLKHGEKKRIICRYKDGREEGISFKQYQIKAAISEQAALESVSDELAQSEIEEIVFEHPDLDLCSSGVEIVDSPGLNEHPDRTTITQQLIKGTDAVIFLVNASRPLTQAERDLMQDLKVQLNGGNPDKPAENLIVAVNFMDLLRHEKDRQDVRQRIERFVKGQNIITGENRVHFISAQVALDAILAGTEDEYLEDFRIFTQSIENFLTVERGSIVIKVAVNKIEGLLQSSLENLHQAKEILDGNLNISDPEKQTILEQIGEVSGRDTRIQIAANDLLEDTIQQTAESWDDWAEGLGERIVQKAERWNSRYSPKWDKEKLLRDYAEQFSRSISDEIEQWWNRQVKDIILKPNLKNLDSKIYQELQAIKSNLQNLDDRVGTNLEGQFSFSTSSQAKDFFNIASDINFNQSEEGGDNGFLGGIGIGGLVGALFAFTGFGTVVSLIAGAVAAIGGFLGGSPSEEELHFKIKQQVLDLGFEKFNESVEEIFNNICEKNIASVFDVRVKFATESIERTISLYENLLEQQEKAYKETLEQRQADKAFIAQKRQELEQLQRNIKTIIPA